MKYITLIFVLLVSFNINANLIVKKKIEFETCKQIKMTGNSNGNGIYTIYPNGIDGISEDKYCDMNCLDGSVCQYNWTHNWGGSGTRANLNNEYSIMKAVDGNIESITELFRAVYSNSIVWSSFTPDTPIENKRITVHWQDYITNGYGNRAHYQLFYVDENGTNIKILNNSNYYSNAAWTDRVQTFDVPYASSIYLWTKDIGKGSPRFKWKEIIVENIPAS